MKFFKFSRNRLIMMTLTVLLFSSFFGSLASADYYSGGRKDNAMPLVYYAASVSNYGYTSHYDAGRAYWNSHLSVNILKSSTTNYRPDIYYIGETSRVGLLGEMAGYTSSGTLTSLSSYWDFTTVTMFDNQMRATGSFTTANIRMNAAHEIGHSIKMAHAASAFNSVMPQGWRPIPGYLTTYDSGEISAKW